MLTVSGAHLVNVDSNVQARIEQVIVVESRKGKGTEADPVRTIVEVFDFSGLLIAQRDSFLESAKEGA